MNFTVRPYEYKARQCAQILDASGTRIVATIHGTGSPIGSACQSDVDLARIMAAGPEMLAALELINDSLCSTPMQDDDIAALIQPIIARAKAVQL
jgi:hypothetical protein